MAENEKKRGGKTFSNHYQPSNESKQRKKGKTLLKESVGLQNWEALAAYVTGEGASKAMRELHALNEKDFLTAYLSLAEYFKAKLSRMEVTGEIKTEITEIRRTVISKAV